MAAAHLTRGGFYAHFRSKAALFAEVLGQEGDFVRRLRSASDAREVISGYLDPENREKVGRGCSLATLTNELPRRDRAAREAFAGHVERLTAEFEAHVSADLPDRRARALEAVASASAESAWPAESATSSWRASYSRSAASGRARWSQAAAVRPLERPARPAGDSRRATPQCAAQESESQ